MIDNKAIVLTGANSGIGYETLKLFAAGKGNRILAVDKNTDKLESFGQNVTALKADVGSKDAIDGIFNKAEELFGNIDIFYANAGFPYYEVFNYADWERAKVMFDTNVFSPIYSYSRYIEHLAGRKGVYAITISAIGQMAMPGFALYSASKFAVEGFQQAIRLELPENVQLTCLYPIATDTGFFKAANSREFEKPFPLQKPDHVAKAMVQGIEKGKKSVSPSKLFGFAKLLMKFMPFVRTVYWGMEKAKLRRFIAKSNQEGK